jgi:hypothetical protein
MDMNQPKNHTVIDMMVFSEALTEFVDSQEKQMIYNRNKYNLGAAMRHYKKAIAGLKELEAGVGSPLPQFDHLRNLDPVKFGLGEHMQTKLQPS